MVDRLAVLDNIPTRISFETMDATSARKQWWFLVQQVEHLPEALIAGREGLWLRHFLIGCPVLALWGAEFEAVGQLFDVAAVWSEIADDLKAVALPNSVCRPRRPGSPTRTLPA